MLKAKKRVFENDSLMISKSVPRGKPYRPSWRERSKLSPISGLPSLSEIFTGAPDTIVAHLGGK